MPETRVNLRHLLEDIRDSYPFPLEEAIVTELVANALDSGASEIRFSTDRQPPALSVVDNGAGMTPRMLKEYHDIASSFKVRGKGIGFAGVGAKLSLLVADEVYTETRREGFHGATRWRLRDEWRAPWQHTLITNMAPEGHGTVVRIELPSPDSKLLEPDFVAEVLQAHFYPLLDPEFMDKILRYIYEEGVAIYVEGQRLTLPPDRPPQTLFFVRRGQRQRPAAVGYLRKSPDELPQGERGVAISTYGKVIKRGWEWLGLAPRDRNRITGVVEVPELAAILTTNKADFLRDSTSLSRYYRYRKAIQRSLQRLLEEMGELESPRRRERRKVDGIEREIGRVLGRLSGQFPELRTFVEEEDPEAGSSPLPAHADGGSSGDEGGPPPNGRIGRRNGGRTPGERTAGEDPAARSPDHPNGPRSSSRRSGPGRAEGGDSPPGDSHSSDSRPNGAKSRQPPPRRRRGGVLIEFADRPERDELGWLAEHTVRVNRAHPAYEMALENDAEDYHIALAVAWALSVHLAGGSPQAFVSRFLSNWAAEG